MSKLKDLTGQKFGYLIPLYIDKSQKHKRTCWVCKCDCGNITTVPTCYLTSGHTKSCGCFKFASRNKKHGMRHTRIYNIWCGMKKRCYDKNEPCYCLYGAKGITVCDQWLNDFLEFYNWSIQNGYNDELSIDRIDNSKGYSPNNCRWVTIAQQQRNKSNNVYLEYKGERKIIVQWCEELGIDKKLVYGRRSRLKRKGKPITFEEIFKGAI